MISGVRVRIEVQMSDLVLVRTQTVSPVKTIQYGSSFLGEMTYALRHKVKQIELNQICQMLNCCVTG